VTKYSLHSIVASSYDQPQSCVAFKGCIQKPLPCSTAARSHCIVKLTFAFIMQTPANVTNVNLSNSRVFEVPLEFILNWFS